MLRHATLIPHALTCIVLLTTAGGLGAAEAPRQEEEGPRATFSERIDVALSTFDVRVVDGLGRPVHGLGADDLRVRLDGAPVPVVAVDWIPAPADPGYDRLATASGRQIPDHLSLELVAPESSERVVFLFQAGLTPGKAIGHLRMLPRLQELVRQLPPTTRAAVATFHSHLTLHQDFTSDRERLAAVLELGHGYHHAALPSPAGGGPSLARHLDGGAMAGVVHPAVAVEMIARALDAEPGPASIVYVGWSLEGSSDEWSGMLATLLATRIPLFVLDVTDADYHSLEERLRYAARETGGSYSNTRDFPGREVSRVRRLLAHGHYRVSVRRPELPVGLYPLRVDLAAWGGFRRVLAPQWVPVVR